MAKLEQGIWVLVCDGKKALLLQNAGDHVYPNLQTREHFQHADLASHEIGTDAPGRTYSSADGRSASVDQGDPHDDAERKFLHGIAARLDRMVEEKAITALIVVAPARALGVLRQALSKNVQQVVREEIDRDYVKEPLHVIEKHLAAM